MAIPAYPTLLKIGDGQGSESFTTIAEITDLSVPDFVANMVEITSHSSPNSAKEFLPTLFDYGEVTFTVNWTPTGATHSQTTGLLRDWKNRTKRNFQLVLSDVGATTWAFAAYVSKFKAKQPVDGVLQADFTLRSTGAWTLAG